MKKLKFKKPVVLGFAALYLTVLGLTTCLMSIKCGDDFTQNFWQNTGSIQRMQTKNQNSCGWYQSFVNFNSYSVSKFQDFSAAAYDEEGRLLAKSGSMAGGGPIVSLNQDSEADDIYLLDTASAKKGAYLLDTFFTKKDIHELAGYQEKYWEEYTSRGDRQRPPGYRICAHLSEDGEDLYGITVQEVTWETDQEYRDVYKDPLLKKPCSYEVIPRMEKNGVEFYSDQYAVMWYETDSRIVFSRMAKPYENMKEPDGKFVEISLNFPYLVFGRKRWEKWSENKYLHDFAEQTDIKNTMLSLETPFSPFCLRKSVLIPIEPDKSGKGRFYLELRMESRPWLAALDYMKYVYLAGAALTLACMLKIIYSANQIYDRQEALDENRKSVISAMAHELREPLMMIENLAKNLQNHVKEEKHDEYLGQIIEKTEEMDRLVGEMIRISKMDEAYMAKGDKEDGK